MERIGRFFSKAVEEKKTRSRGRWLRKAGASRELLYRETFEETKVIKGLHSDHRKENQR